MSYYIQYDKNMMFIRQWESLTEVQSEKGYDISAISQCANGIRKSAFGFVWKYDDTNLV